MWRRWAGIALVVWLVGAAGAQTERVLLANVGNVGAFNQLQLDADGHPVVAFFDQSNLDLLLARCGDPACGDVTLTPVDSAGAVGYDISLQLDADGLAIISYADEGPPAALKLARCHDAACSEATISVVDSGVGVGQYSSMALNADGNPVISYYDGGRGALKLALCGDPACADATLRTLDDDGLVGQETQLRLDADGNPVISYLDTSEADRFAYKLARCADATCTDLTVMTLPDSSGLYSSLHLDAAGNPLLTYIALDTALLQWVRCHDATCASYTLQALAAINALAPRPSLQLDADGNPVIAYHDALRGSLNLLRCADLDCAERETTVLDGGGNVGQFSSLQLDTAGRPVVSYVDARTIDLLLLRCGDPACTVDAD